MSAHWEIRRGRFYVEKGMSLPLATRDHLCCLVVGEVVCRRKKAVKNKSDLKGSALVANAESECRF